jgi:hypothetical protein
MTSLLERVIYLAHQPPVPISEARREHMAAFFTRTEFGENVPAFEVWMSILSTSLMIYF